MTMTTITPKLLRLPAVLAMRGIGKSQHYYDIQAGLFTPPVKISLRASAWPVHEVAAINTARIAGKSTEEIRELVRKLITARKTIT